MVTVRGSYQTSSGDESLRRRVAESAAPPALTRRRDSQNATGVASTRDSAK